MIISILQALCLVLYIHVARAKTGANVLSLSSFFHLDEEQFHVELAGLANLPDPILHSNGDPFITVEFLNNTELLSQPTSVWMNYSQTTMAIGNLDGSLIRMNETSTVVLLAANDHSTIGEPDEHAIFGITSDNMGNIFFSQFYHCTIRKVDAHGVITIVAGLPEVYDNIESKRRQNNRRMGGQSAYTCEFTPDGNAANESSLSFPGGLQYDPVSHNLFFSDHAGMTIRHFKAHHAGSDLHTLAGRADSEPGFAGDNGPAKDAVLGAARYFWLSSHDGNMYIADALNNRVRVVNMATKKIKSLSHQFSMPYGITGDNHGHIYISSAGSYFFLDRTRVENSETIHFAGTGQPVRGEVAYGQFSTRVPVSNASFLLYEPSMGLLVAQEDLENILIITPSPAVDSDHYPTIEPSREPTVTPTDAPTYTSTNSPTHAPSVTPSYAPSRDPTYAPTHRPSVSPSIAASETPTVRPSNTFSPTRRPSTLAPTKQELPVITLKTDLEMDGFESEDLSEKEKDSVKEGTGKALGVDKNSVTIDNVKLKTRRRQLMDISTTQHKMTALVQNAWSSLINNKKSESVSLIISTTIAIPVVNLIAAGSNSFNVTALAASLKTKLLTAVSSGNLTQLIQKAAVQSGLTLTITVTGASVVVTIEDAPPAEDTQKEADVGLIVGVVIGGGAGVLLLLAVMIYCLRGDTKVLPVNSNNDQKMVHSGAMVPITA